MKLLSVLSTEFSNLKRLIVKVSNGKSRTVTAEEVSNYGVDSNPVKGMVAVYGTSEVDGAEVIIGYLNKDRLAAVGEMRIFATDTEGTLQLYLHLKNDGTAAFGGTADNLMRFSPAKEGFDELRADLNDLTAKFNAHVHPTTTPGSPTGPTATPASSSTASIDDSKIDEITTL